VTHLGRTAPANQKYWYDANGNVTRRINGSQDVTLTYDAENRLTGVSGGASANFVYNGDGQRVKQKVGATTTVFIGNYYEQTGSNVTKYYYANGQRVAMRTAAGVTYVHTDHLGSTSVTSGAQPGNTQYFPYGATRSGTVSTTYRFTGQRLDDSTGLYYYGARYYDAALGRFIQPDTIVPNPVNPQALNRYSYVLNNPLRYTDPTGHREDEGTGYEPDPNYWLDLTLWLVSEANYDALLFEVQLIRLNNAIGNSGQHGAGNKAFAVHMWIQLVQDHGPWDFKVMVERELGQTIRLGDYWFEYSTAGNILYGFNGAAAGFSLQGLHAGAGAAQVLDHLSRGAELGPPVMFFDTVDDYYAVEFGYQLYKKAYAPDSKMTVSEFNALLVQYEHRDQMALREPPGPARAVDANWPYSPGYFNGPLQPRPPFLFPSFRR